MSPHRMIALALLTAPFFGAAACADTKNVADAQPTSDAPSTPDAPSNTVVTSQFQLRNAMRVLWRDHVVWTRAYLISAIADLPDMSTAAERLLRNQADIGNAIKPFYGDAAGDALTALLRTHITIAVEIVTAAKASDSAKLTDAKARWSTNADEIATFLAGANPNWALADLKQMMQMHLAQTLVEATARLTGDWDGDVKATDEVNAHIISMADVLTSGIAKQFPQKVSTGTTMGTASEDLHRSMRVLWEEHVIWTRFYVIGAVAGLPDATASAERLLRNQKDIGDALKPLYGDAAGDALTNLLRSHITIAVEIVAAARVSNEALLADAKVRWSTNADEIATFLAAANPNWSVTTLKEAMRMHLDQTLVEATARLKSDWAGDVVAFDRVREHILGMADILSDGIVKQFPAKFVGGPATTAH